MRYSNCFWTSIITAALMTVSGCTRDALTTVGSFRILHDTDDQSLQAITLRSDGGFMAAVINTYSENLRSLSYGLMAISPNAQMEYHHRTDYYFGNLTFNDIIETTPGMFFGVGYNSAIPANRRSLIAKFDQSGHVIDSMVILVNNSRIRFGKIHLLADGNYLLMASCVGSGSKTASYFMKFSDNLQKLWEKVVEGADLGISHFRGFDFTETESGEILAAGINSALSTVNGVYNEGRLAVVKLTPDGQMDTFRVLQYPRFRIVGGMALENGKLHIFSSARVIEDAGGKRELSINTFSMNLDSLDQHRIRHGQEAWLDANFMVKRKGGWFVSGFSEAGQTFFYVAQKPFLFMLDEQFNIVGSRRFGSDRVASFVSMMKSKRDTYFLAYGDYLPGATRYGYDIILEEIDYTGNILK